MDVHSNAEGLSAHKLMFSTRSKSQCRAIGLPPKRQHLRRWLTNFANRPAHGQASSGWLASNASARHGEPDGPVGPICCGLPADRPRNEAPGCVGGGVSQGQGWAQRLTAAGRV